MVRRFKDVVWWQLLLITTVVGYTWLRSGNNYPDLWLLLGFVLAMLVTLIGVILAKRTGGPSTRITMRIAGYLSVPFLLAAALYSPIWGLLTAYLLWFLICTILWQWRTKKTVLWNR